MDQQKSFKANAPIVFKFLHRLKIKYMLICEVIKLILFD